MSSSASPRLPSFLSTRLMFSTACLPTVCRINFSTPATICMTFMPCEGCGRKGLRSMLKGGMAGLLLCTLPAFTLVSLYQLDNALMKHDRTSFHSHVGADVLKCLQLHCFVALAGKENFKWPHSNVLFASSAVGITTLQEKKKYHPERLCKPRSEQLQSDKCFIWCENPPKIEVHVVPVISQNIQHGEYWIICEHKQSQQARVCDATKKHNLQLFYL